MLAAPLRILATFWVYDRETRALLTTDVFGHTAVQSATDSPVLESLADDPSTLESARAHVLAKFPWIPYADMDSVEAKLDQIFAERKVDMIAPMHGCVLKGGPLVFKHVQLLHNILGQKLEATA